MCGISGILNFHQTSIRAEVLQKMTDCISHRGPDAQGHFFDKHIALGHRRLSIIDLSALANQPMTDSTERFTIVFNGEIYNFQEVKQKLKPYPYKTHGDTEVVLAAYIQLGPKCLDLFAGMFSIAIWDNIKQTLFLARDRLGVKPLYYSKVGDYFLFSSELRSILNSGLIPRKINPEAIHTYFQFQSISSPLTMVDGVLQVKAGYYFEISSNSVSQTKYWSLYDQKVEQKKTAQEIKSDIYGLLLRSVERRMVSDVPVGAFLSGGIESTAIVGLMSRVSNEPINTFTLGFSEKQFDESTYAEIVAKKFNTRHNSLFITPNDVLNEIQSGLDSMDMPTADGINSYVVSKAIKNSGITVALSGIGGDELFCGYPIFKHFLKLKQVERIMDYSMPLRSALFNAVRGTKYANSKLVQLLSVPNSDITSVYKIFRQVNSDFQIKELIKSYQANQYLDDAKNLYSGFPFLSQVTIAELSGYTQNTLLRDTDQMSMAVSLEVREPFFDHNLIEYILNVPDEIKFPYEPKKLLVDSLGDLIPKEIFNRKKQGFLIPWYKWLRSDLKEFSETLIARTSNREIFNKHEVLGLWRKFLKNDKSVSWIQIWLLVVMEYWLEANEIN